MCTELGQAQLYKVDQSQPHMQKKELMAQEYLAGKFIPLLWTLCPKKNYF